MPGGPQSDPVARAYELLAEGHRLDALEHFERQITERPGELAPAFGALAVRHTRLAVDDSEQQIFEQRIDRFIADASSRYNRNKKDDEALFYLSQAHMLRGGFRFEYGKGMWGAARDGATAKNYSDAYVARHPEHGDAYLSLGLYNYYVSLAPSYFKAVSWLLFLPSGNRAEGLKQIERAASTGQWFAPRARLVLMDIYSSLEQRPSEALAIGRRLEERYPDNDHVGLALADVYLGPALEDRDRAAEIYQGLIDRAPNDAGLDTTAGRLRATIGLAAVRQEQWRLADAIALLTPIIESRIERPSWAIPQTLLRRGNYRALLNDPAAVADAKAIVADPAFTKWHEAAADQIKWIQARHASGEAALYTSLLAGNRLTVEKKWDAAKRAYDDVRVRNPQNAQVRYRLAYLSFARGDAEGAVPEMTALANGGRSVPEWLRAGALLTIARVHDLAGRREQARRTYQTIVDRYENEYAARAARIGLITPYVRPA